MLNRGSFVLRLIGILLLVGLMIGGGVMAYRAGVAQGIAQAPAVAEALLSAVESGQGLSLPAYGYGYGYPSYRMHPHFGFFPFGGIFGSILFIFLFFGLLRLIFFRPWAWHYGPMQGRDPWKRYGHPWGPPPWAREGEAGEPEADTETKKEDK
ncbi:MAG: hypothetical protein JW963_01745 [Anaerolineales bacterium]|nr:hypothetical protein [Anaerolineales bacterium]